MGRGGCAFVVVVIVDEKDVSVCVISQKQTRTAHPKSLLLFLFSPPR